MPDCPVQYDSGVPDTGLGSSTPFLMIRNRPARSVTSIVPSGRNVIPKGYSRAVVTAVTRMRCPSAVSKSIGSFGNGRPASPDGATGILNVLSNGTVCWPSNNADAATNNATQKAALNRSTLCLIIDLLYDCGFTWAP